MWNSKDDNMNPADDFMNMFGDNSPPESQHSGRLNNYYTGLNAHQDIINEQHTVLSGLSTSPETTSSPPQFVSHPSSPFPDSTSFEDDLSDISSPATPQQHAASFADASSLNTHSNNFSNTNDYLGLQSLGFDTIDAHLTHAQVHGYDPNDDEPSSASMSETCDELPNTVIETPTEIYVPIVPGVSFASFAKADLALFGANPTTANPHAQSVNNNAPLPFLARTLGPKPTTYKRGFHFASNSMACHLGNTTSSSWQFLAGEDSKLNALRPGYDTYGQPVNGIPLGCIDVRVLDGGGAQSNNTQYFGITGTQFGHDQNRLAFFQFTRSKLLNVDSNINRKGVKRVFSYHVGPPVGDCRWLNSGPSLKALYAAGKGFGWVEVSPQRDLNGVLNSGTCPLIHLDDITEIDINSAQILASADRSGTLFVTDLNRLLNETLPVGNLIYTTAGGSPITSVKWCCGSTTTLSVCSQNCGFYVVDVRQKNPALVMDMNHVENALDIQLYTHCHLSDTVFALGYQANSGNQSSGLLELIDIRMNAPPSRPTVVYQDPALTAVGDLSYCPRKQRLLAAGIPCASLYRVDVNALELHNEGTLCTNTVENQQSILTRAKLFGELNLIVSVNSLGVVIIHNRVSSLERARSHAPLTDM